MKRVLFIPGVEGMSGILGARAGKLVYAEHNNPAFDAPNGRQYARNYGHRIVLNQRVSDGAAFFSLKSKSATLISTATKTNMAILGSIKPIRQAIKTTPGALEATISQVYNYLKSVGAARVEGLSYEQYIETNLRAMLKAKNTAWGDAAPAISKSFSVTNPYYLEGGGSVPEIRQDIFDKFFPYLAFTSVRKQNALGGIKIDGEAISIPYAAATGVTMSPWIGVVGTAGSYLSPNYQAYLLRKGLSIDEDHDYVFFNEMRFYKPTSQTAEVDSDTIVAGTAYTTIQPES